MNRRSFIKRACLGTAGFIFVPKYVDTHVYKPVREIEVINPEWENAKYGLHPFFYSVMWDESQDIPLETIKLAQESGC